MFEHTLSLDEIDRKDVQQCGGKGANLGELIHAGVAVPAGFCVSTEALLYTLDCNALNRPIAEIAGCLNFEDYGAVESDTARIRSMIVSALIPPDLEDDIRHQYRKLIRGKEKFVAVRSSVAVRDSPISSFPGMMDTYHFVPNEPEVLSKIRECWASLWTARAAFTRHRKQIPHERGLIAAVVQLMVHADTAGVLFTSNPITHAAGEMVIEANWGLGESVVSGQSMNDFYVIDKERLSVKQKTISPKTMMVTIDEAAGAGRKERPIPKDKQSAPTLSDAQLLELAQAGQKIEDHFGFNADIEWAYQDKTLFILQARQIWKPSLAAAS